MNYVLWHNVWHDVAFPNMSARANTPATAKCARAPQSESAIPVSW